FDQTITSDESDYAWSKFLTGHQVKASAVDISVAAAVDDDFVPALGQVAQFRLGNKRPVQFPPQKASVTRRYNQQAAVSKLVEGDRLNRRYPQLDDDFPPAIDTSRNDLLRTPVGEPQAVVVPAWRFTEHKVRH